MPQELQIVPRYLHSHVETYINDNTRFEDTTSQPVDTNSKFICVFRSGKGVDNVLVKKTDLVDFKKTYGKSDYNKYGQPLMMPMAMLSTGSASCYCMRVMPDDAMAANAVVSVKYKVIDVETTTYIDTYTDNNGVTQEVVWKKVTGSAGYAWGIEEDYTLVRGVPQNPDATGPTENATTNVTKVKKLVLKPVTVSLNDECTSNKAVKILLDGYVSGMTPKKPTDFTTTTDAQGNPLTEASADFVDAKGYKTMPILTVRSTGRGIYGNNYRFRVNQNLDYSNDYGITMMSFEACSTENGFNVEQTAVGSLVTSSKYNSITCINDIIDSKETGDVLLDFRVSEENVETLYDIYKEVALANGVAEADIPDLDQFDPLNGTMMNTKTIDPNLDVITLEEESKELGFDYETATESQLAQLRVTNLDSATGIALRGGSDGIFGITENQIAPDGTEIDYRVAIYNAEKECYKNAFNGTYDRYILSTRRTPTDALLDANYDFEVKQTLFELASARNSSLLYLDCGIDTTYANIENVVAEYQPFTGSEEFSRVASLNFQHYKVRDFETKKKCDVTVTYFFAQMLPIHFADYGNFVPFVKTRAQLTGHVNNSLEPSIDDIDLEKKELLYTNRINYFETIDENVYQRASQNTAQRFNSDLLEENNMHVLFELKNQLELDCWFALYDFTSAEDRTRFSESEKAKFANWEGRKLDTLDIKFDVNEWEMERSIVHCYVAVQFRNLNKRTIIEIDVNKRNFLG